MAQNKKTAGEAKREEKELISWSKSYWLQAPLMAIVAIIPLIVYYHVFDSKLSQYEWFGGSDRQVDFYVWAKMFLFLGVCIYALLVLLFQHFFGEHRLIWKKQFIPLIIYGALTILSTIFSISKYHSLHGSYQQFESVWVLLGYCLIAYYAFYLIRTQEALWRLLNWFGIGAGLMSVIGLSQILGHDLLQTKLGKTIITPTGFDINKLSWSIEKGRTYLTLENPNYVGSYVALMVPILIGVSIAAEKTWKKIVFAVLTAIMIVILFASQSRTGIVALAAGFFVMLLFARKSVIKHWRISIGAVVALVGIFVFYNIATDNYLLGRIKDMIHLEKTEYVLRQVETNEENVVLWCNGNELTVWLEENKKGDYIIKLLDGDGKAVEYPAPASDGWSYLEDERFPISMRLWNVDGYDGIQVWEGYRTWFFTDDIDEKGHVGYYCYTAGRMKKMSKEREYHGFFAEHQRFGSGRGFIWSRTFPLLKRYFLFGSGPDTYAQAFPNDETAGLINAHYQGQFISKPHSFFLQIGEQTGVPALLVVLIFVGGYIVDTFRAFWKTSGNNGQFWLAVSVMGAVIGFLVSGLTNDSLMGITPIFYIVLGLGIRMNHMK